MKQKLATLIATFLYSGLSPKAPGTAGSLLAIIIAMALFPMLSVSNLIIATLVLYFIGVWSSNIYMKETGTHDPGSIVIDEAAGIAITMAIAFPVMRANNIWEIIISGSVVFIFFRVFDILKPWPIRVIDKKVTGGHGVMLDDIAAGLFAGIFSYFTLYYL